MTFSENEAPTLRLLNPLADPPARRPLITRKYELRGVEAQCLEAASRAMRVAARCGR